MIKEPSTSVVKIYKGRPTIHINGKPEAPMIYALTDIPGGRWSWEEIPKHNIKNFSDAGFRLFQLDIFLDHLWFEDNAFDICLAQKQVRGVLDINPDAAIMFRFHVNPPKWWAKKHPEEHVKYDGALAREDFNTGLERILHFDACNISRYSLASLKWRRETTQKLILFLNEFSQTEEGNYLFGIQLAGGIYGEWHYWGFLKWEPDFSEPMQTYFREWLRNKYRTASALKSAWNNPLADFDTATVPLTKERNITSAGIFRDPEKDMKTIDYYTCQHELVGNNVLHFCKTVKENWPRPIITGAFYGYFFSVFNRLAAGSQLDLRQILKSKDIDFLCGPQVYLPECYKSGEPYRSRSLIHSILLNGKLWLDEMDQEPTRTFPILNGTIDNTENYNKKIIDNISTIRRNIMFTHSKGMGLWFYDFGPGGQHTNNDNEENNQYGVSGYWDNPEYLKQIKELKTLSDRTLHIEYKSEADILMVFDTEVMYHIKSTGDGDPVTNQIIDYITLQTFYSGVIFDPIYIEDLDKVNLSQYRVILFGNTFLLSGEQKQFIHKNLAGGGRHLIWIYAPGFSNGKIVSKDFVSEITGINLDLEIYDKIPEVIINEMDIPIQSPTGICSPLFSVNDPEAIALGYFKHNNKTAFAKKVFKDYTSWFIAVPPIDSNLLRNIYKTAGVNIYTNEKDIVYGGSGVITFHTRTGGKKIIHLKNEKVIHLNLPKHPVTILIDSKTGKIIS